MKRFVRFRKRAAITVAVVLSLLATGLQAQFGFSIVSDPAQEAHSLQQIQQEVQQLAVLRNSLQTLINEYNQLKANARYFTSKAAWTGMESQIQNSWTLNRYGETANWNTAIVNGLGTNSAWQLATIALHPSGYYGSLPASSPALANLATVEIADGAETAAMQTVANARSSQATNYGALTRWETAVADPSQNTNSELEQLNLANAGLAIHARQMQDQNALLTTIAEQQIVANKLKRDALANHVNFMSRYDGYLASEGPQWGSDPAAAIHNARLQ
jgi:hypothetical protein